MKTIDLLIDELRSMEGEHQLRYESLCRLLNYWYPILGYDSANEMSYPVWGDSRARPAPYIAQLEAALVEEKAKALYYAYADRSYIYGWLDANEDDREQWRDRSRVELEELGILQKGAE